VEVNSQHHGKVNFGGHLEAVNRSAIPEEPEAFGEIKNYE